jgi:hypothetical protein
VSVTDEHPDESSNQHAGTANSDENGNFGPTKGDQYVQASFGQPASSTTKPVNVDSDFFGHADQVIDTHCLAAGY